MKTKYLKHGPQKFKAYLKPVGKGYEVGLMHGAKNLFVGNFINNSEAQAWYQMMGREFARFSRRYWPTDTKPNAFFHQFITNSLYKHYYDYLDKCFGKHTKTYHREWTRDVKKYNRLKKHWATKDIPYTRRAA